MAKKKNKKQNAKKSTPSLDTHEKKLLTQARKICRDGEKYVRSLPTKSQSFAEGLDFDEARTNRRISATLGMLESVRPVVAPICPDVPDFFSFEDYWLHINLMPTCGCDFHEERSFTLTAAALWMLDQLRETGHFFDARELFPQDDYIYEQADYPDIWDTSHEDETLLGMLWIIQHRNDDCTGLPEPAAKKKQSGKPLPRYYFDRYTTQNLHRQDVPSRRLFEQMLAFIEPDQIERAVKMYEDLFWDLIRRIFASRNVYAMEEQAHELLFEEYRERTEVFFRDAQKFHFGPDEKGPMPIFPDSQNGVNLLKAPEPISQFKERARLMGQAEKLQALQADMQWKMDELDGKIVELSNSIGQMLVFTKENRIKFYGPEVAKIWEDFRIQDPYTLCFAYLYLVDQGSDLPWLYGISGAINQLCGSILPWKYGDFEFDPEGVWHHWDESTQHHAFGAKKAELPKRIKVPTLENWYDMDYVDKSDPEWELQDATNLAQIIYEITGGVMPRNLSRYENVLETLDSYGITGKKALHPLMYCMTMLGELRHRTHNLHMPELPESEPKNGKAATADDLQKQLQALQRENKQLREALHSTAKEARDSKKKIETVEQTAEADRQELADLRELVFHQQQEDYLDETSESTIQFPYTPRKRTVIFGGHDSWAREIKPKLPGARFIDRTMLPNAQLIRRADVVWIQSNALSHAFFYKIIDETRKYQIPVRYFTYASATKCAEQLAIGDMEG